VATVGVIKLKMMQGQCLIKHGHCSRLFGCAAVTTVSEIAGACQAGCRRKVSAG
jgi:hypothetical protein